VTGCWAVSELPLAHLAAGSSGGQVVWVAALSAVGGAAVTLLVQLVSGHNSNRRADGMMCGELVADFLAAGQAIVRALPASDGLVQGRRPARTAARRSDDHDGQLPDDATAEVREALTRLDTCYARAILILPALQEQLEPVRTRVTAFVAEGPRDATARGSLAADLDALITDVRPHLRIPLRGLGI
jgi:hypothetical protein